METSRSRPKKRSSKKGKGYTFTSKGRTFLRLFEEAVRANTPVSITDLLLKAGYAAESARQYTNIIAPLRPEMAAITSWAEGHKRKIQEKMDEKIEGAAYAELARAWDTLSYYGRLEKGQSTHNVALLAEHRRQLDALIEE